MNRPLTIMGCDRALFFFAVTIGAGVWISFETIIGGLLFFIVSVQIAKRLTQTDRQMLRIIINGGKFRKVYDPFKRTHFVVSFVRRR